MFEKIKAWKELIKLEKLQGVKEREHWIFFRGNIIRALQEEKFFDFLDVPRSKSEIMSKFGYSEIQLLERLLSALTKDGSLNYTDAKWQTIRPINDDWRPAKNYFDENAREIWISYAKAFPNRLRGKYFSFSEGFNLFNWDEALSMPVYEILRRSTFSYCKDIFKRPGKFLDIGCGNGYGTVAIWSYYLQKDAFIPSNEDKIQFFGIDTNHDLINIAQSEFNRMLTIYNHRSEKSLIYLRKKLKNFQGTLEEVEKYTLEKKAFFPHFQVASAEKLPFKDNEFDYVYVSQVLHWTDLKLSLSEAIRVLKPNGILFGNESFLPKIASDFMDFHVRVVEGNHGYVTKREFIQIARMAGGKKIKFATPITVFRMAK